MSWMPAPTKAQLAKEETQQMAKLSMLTELAIEEAEKSESAGKELKTIVASIKQGFFDNPQQLLEPLNHVLAVMGETA